LDSFHSRFTATPSLIERLLDVSVKGLIADRGVVPADLPPFSAEDNPTEN
jgi:hypothetical protein